MLMPTVKPVPEGHHTVAPYLVVENAAAAIDFYVRALGAIELFSMPGPDGRIMHAEVLVGDSPVMLCDANPDMGSLPPSACKGSPVSMFLYVTDVKALFDQAVVAGAEVKVPPTDMFWGDRYAQVTDPFGHTWQMATHIEDVSPEEMAKRAGQAAGA
jgi:PhnB protein